MHLLKRLVKILLVLSLFFLFIPVSKEINIKIKTNKIIKNKVVNEYLGYIYIPKFDYKNIIDNKSNTLDDNEILLPSFSGNIGDKRIILAGHNNRYVFNKIYSLDLDDSVIISDFNVDYKYRVVDKYIIEVDDFSTFDEDDTLYLMTCTDNNQERFIVKTKKDL